MLNRETRCVFGVWNGVIRVSIGPRILGFDAGEEAYVEYYYLCSLHTLAE